MIYSSYLSTLLSLIPAILGIGFLITIHEFGHFIFCQIFGIPTPRFAVGIGPIIYKKQFKRTLFSIGIIPVAGYVEIGEGETKETSSLLPYKLWKSFFVIFGGIIMNLLAAYIFVIAITIFDGSNNLIKKFSNQPIIITKNINNLISDDSAPSSSENIILEYNGNTISSFADMMLYANNSANKQFFTTIENKPESTESHIESFDSINLSPETFFDNNLYKITPGEPKKNISLFEKIAQGIKTTNNIIKHTARSFMMLFSNKNYKKISGIVGMTKTLADATKNSFAAFFALLAIVSINLALLNIMPLPILDGGQFLLLLIKKLFPRCSFALLETVLLYGSLFIISIIMIFTTYFDVIRCFFGK